MSKVHDIREAKSTTQQASEWVALLASEDASAEDRERCTAWLNEDPANQAAFDELNHTLNRVVAMGDRFRSTVVEGDSVTIADNVSPSRKGYPRRKWFVWTAAAAAVIVAAVGVVMLGELQKAKLYRTDVGQQTTFTLSDWSTVQLNTDTELLVTFTDDARNIALRRGEAFFDVAHDSNRPFVVEAGLGSIRAVGTGFVVRVDRDVVAVTVTEGIVELKHESQTSGRSAEPDERADAVPAAKLGEGYRVEYDRRVGSPAVVAPEELDRDLAWRQGLLIFENQTLEEVLHEVGRYTETRLIIADSKLIELRVGGAFRSDDLEALLEFFEKGLNISVNRDVPNTVYLTAVPPVRVN